ncbi:MAG TPA: radical SAM protein, partial [Rhodocyclaceae bacterium]|nr:radical SAM protein [Rhodocyclaceae bacterium]
MIDRFPSLLIAVPSIPAPRPRVLSIIPPMTQLNTPYPSTAYLTGFLRSRGLAAAQDDLALKLVLRLFSASGLVAIEAHCAALPVARRSPAVLCFEQNFERYRASVDAVISFLQGSDTSLAFRIASRNFLPEGPRFAALDEYVDPDGGDPLAWAFGMLGVQDRARHFATLYLNDLADVLRDAVDPRFEFVRYAESLALSQPTFEPLAEALAAAPTLVDSTLAELTRETIARHFPLAEDSGLSVGPADSPPVVLLSVPFPGSVYAAFRIARIIKAARPEIVTVLGGGYVNTELRELAEPRVFDYFDYVTLDDGELPLLNLLEHLDGRRPREQLKRTFCRDGGAVRYIDSDEPDVPFAAVG